ncbi:MAG: hypothetical protein SWI22_02675 [Pseudomonadota bacterium]|nr:hypothetical protein [Pseudomonadota bacterium]
MTIHIEMAKSGIDWLPLAGQVLATFLGGGLVILANELAERRRQENARQDEREHERALYAGVFAIRNFVIERLNHTDDIELALTNIGALESALRAFNRLIEKTKPQSQSLMIVIFEIGLQLDAVVSEVARMRASPKRPARHFDRAVDDLVAAFEQFELISADELIYITDDELDGLAKHRGPNEEEI